MTKRKCLKNEKLKRKVTRDETTMNTKSRTKREHQTGGRDRDEGKLK